HSGMDEAAIEAAGVKPIQPDLDRIAALADRKDLLPELARLHLLRVDAGFAFTSTPDAKNSARMIAELAQAGLTLPDRDYYLKDDRRMAAVREAFLAHLRKMLALLGEKEDEAARQAKAVLEFETRLARASRSRVDLRDPHLNYHLLTAADLD